VYYYKECFVREGSRLVKTADYTFSEVAHTEEGKAIMRNAIGTDLGQTGGKNPILGDYYSTYKSLPSKQGKLSEREERERAFKTAAVQSNSIFESYVSDF